MHCNHTLQVMHGIQAVMSGSIIHTSSNWDGNCFNMDCLPTFPAGLHLAWTGLCKLSLLFWEKQQATCQPSSTWHLAWHDHFHDEVHFLSLDVAKRFWRQTAHCPIPMETVHKLVKVGGPGECQRSLL